MATQVGADWPSGAGAPGHRVAFLLALTDALRSVADARSVMRVIAERLGQVLRADGVGYGEIDETHAFLTVAEYWCGPDVTSLVGRHRLDDFGPAADALRAGEEVVVADVLDPAVSPDPAVAAAFQAIGVRAALAVPILRDEAVVAALVVHRFQPHVWSEDERRLVTAVAERTWEAVGRARAERAMQRDLDDAAALQEVSNQLIQEDDVEALFARILDAAITFARADAGSMQLLDSETGELELLDLRGFHPDSAEYWGHIHDHSVTSCGEALRTGERVVVPDFELADWLAGTRDLDLYRQSGLRSVQTTPLVTRDGRTVGMLSTHWRTVHRPTPSDLRLVDVLARQAADLIERRQTQALRRRAFEQEREARLRAEQLEQRAMRLQQLTASLAQAESVEAVGRIVVGDFIAAVDGAGGSLFLCDPALGGLRLLEHRGRPADMMERHAVIPFDAPLPVADAVVQLRPTFHADAAVAREAFPAFGALLDVAPDLGEAWAHLPLPAAGRVVGVLVVAYAAPQPFDALDRAHLLAAAAAAGQALQRVALLEVERAARRRTELLALLTGELAVATGPEEIVERTVAVLAGGFADTAAVVAIDGSVLAAAGTDVAAVAGDAERGDHDGNFLGGPLGDQRAPILVVGSAPERPFADADRHVFDEVCTRVAGALARSALHAHEHDVSVRLQESLVAGQDLPPETVSVKQAYLPGLTRMQVGGDWTDIIALDDRRVALTVGDVVGRGIDAAAAMGRLRSALAAILTDGAAPGEAIDRLDRFARRVAGAEYTTVAICLIDTASGEMTYACAGHPPPLLLDGGACTYLWDARSAPIGVGAAARTSARCTVGAGATVLLYTDGLVERRSRPLEEGLAALADVARETADGDLAAMREQILARLVVPSEQRDDTALLLARVERIEAARFTRTVERAVELADLRRAIRAWLEAHAVAAADTHDVLLAVGEAAANAIEHGHAGRVAPVEVTLALAGGSLSGTVRDAGRWKAPHSDPDRGRGLEILRAVADDVTITRGDGTTVAFQRDLRHRNGRS
jgi:serine/threonine-protein kinase RsbW